MAWRAFSAGHGAIVGMPGRCFLNGLIAGDRYGKIHPTLSRTHTLDEVVQTARDAHRNLHRSKVDGPALPEEGFGVLIGEMRAEHIDKINAAVRGV